MHIYCLVLKRNRSTEIRCEDNLHNIDSDHRDATVHHEYVSGASRNARNVGGPRTSIGFLLLS